MRSFQTTYTPQFHEANPGGVVAASRLIDVAHVAYERWVVQQVGFGWQDWFMNPCWAVAVRHVLLDAQLPTFAGTELNISLRCEILSSTSFTLHTELSKERIHAIVNATYVFIDRETLKRCNIPVDVTKKLES